MKITGSGSDVFVKPTSVPTDNRPAGVVNTPSIPMDKSDSLGKETVREASTDTKSQKEMNDMSEEMLVKSIEQANRNLVQYNRFIERTVHEVTHTVMYKLKDSVTNEVIREFPPKKIQDMIAKMWELAGLFVDEKA